MGALKVVLLGDSAVGKSSLLRSYTTGTFDAHVPNTIGAAFVSTEHTVGDRTVKMEIWDTAGQERYRSLTPMYYRNGRVALVCFDMSNAWVSFEKARYWLEQLALSGPSDIAVKLVGTKSDLSPNLSTNSKNSETSNLVTNNLGTNQRHKDSESNERNKVTLDKSKTDQINRDSANSNNLDPSEDSNNLDTSEDSNLNNLDTSEDVNLGTSDLDMETGRGMVEIQRYCLEHDIPLYSTSAKTNTGIQKIFDDIVNEVEEDFFNEPAPQILLQERPQSKCC